MHAREFFLLLQVTLFTYSSSYGYDPFQPPTIIHTCNLEMSTYSADCEIWTVLSVIALNNSTDERVDAAREFIKKVTNDCDKNSQMKVYLPGKEAENSNDSLYTIGNASDSLLDPICAVDAYIQPANRTLVFDGLLTYLANLATTTSTQGGAAFIFTDMDCTDEEFVLFAQSFLTALNQTVFNTKFFFYDETWCPSFCDNFACSIGHGSPEVTSETTCLSPTVTHAPTSQTTTKPPFPTTEDLILLITIPSLALIILVAVVACCCCRFVNTKKFKKIMWDRDTNLFGKIWMNRFAESMDEEHSAPPSYRTEDGNYPPVNLAVSENYMDLEHISKRNKNDAWEFEPKNLIVHENEILGNGAFASVFKATAIGRLPMLKAVSGAAAALANNQDGRTEAAVKRLPAHADEQNRKDFFHEMDFMKRLGYHAHVIAMLGCISDQWDPLIVVEYCHYGDLLRFIRGHRSDFFGGSNSNDSNDSQKSMTLSVKSLVSFAWQISDGMSYLASRNFVHRDLAARNVLVTKNMVLKISDFGLCRYTDQALYTAKGGKLPIKWMSIEALKFGEFSPKSDIWSFGVTLWEIFSLGETPYNAVQPTDMLIHLEDGNRLPRPQFCPNEIQEIMERTWNPDQKERQSFDEIRAKLALMLNLNDEAYGYLTVVHKEPDKSICRIDEDEIVFKL